MMNDRGKMIIKLISCTDRAEDLCEAAAKSCYSDKSAFELQKSNADKTNVLEKTISMEHLSVIEHAVFTFSIEGVSRSLTHQLVRHRVASFSQQSQRYVSMKNTDYVIPYSVKMNPETLELYNSTMSDIWAAYGKLLAKIPAEDARYVLPNACTTNIVVTMNARELLHFFTLRCCNRAQWEIRELADEMLRQCKKAAPIIFKNAGAPCVRGSCPERELSCRKPRILERESCD